ncbi:elongation factor G [Peloplasma aerotolerans]|uniref:Elongation factor G n=1 Tax=Peloplasma aerotolerans TaxID=3044389 RepID=A0AAW6UBJ0_9MOLU|nr:elongation factor G [Mariniplasma sp. M4Ah]MDI6452881.1 elongation factor G [Mariniplasma sp. M4Ah]MDR4968509.1 elongation factor G [Acholeplasmataceae bacterium]
MKEYTTKEIRNIAVLGHQGSGKTSISEALLFASKAIDKKGEVERKNTVSDYLVEEQIKQSSLSLSVLPVEWENYKLNFIDVPGSDEFVGDITQALEVVKGAIILIDATKGVEVGTERIWQEIRKRHIPAMIFVNKMDKENVKFEKVLDDIREKLGKKAVPFCWPIGHDENFEGFVNVIEMKARIFDGVESHDAEIWDEKKPKVDELHNMILESVAETSEELLDLYLSGEEIPEQKVKDALRLGIIDGELTPVLVGSATKTIGVRTLLNMLIDYLPAPNELTPLKGKDAKTGAEIIRRTTDDEPFSAYVFKTTVDPFLGAVNILKINSGILKLGQEVVISNKGDNKKITNIFAPRGRTQIECTTFHAGDMAAVAKLDGIETGDTLADPKSPIVYEPVPIPTSVIYIAVHPKNKNDEDKISMALHRINQEDPTFEIKRNKETSQLLLGGQGMTHLNYVLERMKNMFKVDVDVEEQKIVYRETIKKSVQAEGKHKKQSGGAGQFGHVWIKFEPTKELFEFSEDVFGGAVPRNYFPAVEKGLIETFEAGPLAGFPVINVKATLYDGSYHPVDSNEISFKLAASLAFKDAVKTCQPTILEPIVKVEVTVKDQFVGDVMGDMNKRRGRVLGMNQTEGYQVVIAEVPEAEIVKYAIDLKAMTQGSGVFTREFLRYEEVPNNLIDKIVEAYKK